MEDRGSRSNQSAVSSSSFGHLGHRRHGGWWSVAAVVVAVGGGGGGGGIGGTC